MRGRADSTRAGSGTGKRPVWILLLAVLAALAATAVAAYSSRAAAAPDGGKVVAVGAESQYADVIAQVGGRYVAASAVMSNPNTDPHSFEASIAVAREVGDARLVVQNGLGYVLLSAHDMNPLLGVMDRIVYVAGGHAAAGPADEVVTSDALTRLYGHRVDVIRVHGRVLVVAGE